MMDVTLPKLPRNWQDGFVNPSKKLVISTGSLEPTKDSSLLSDLTADLSPTIDTTLDNATEESLAGGDNTSTEELVAEVLVKKDQDASIDIEVSAVIPNVLHIKKEKVESTNGGIKSIEKRFCSTRDHLD